jgi:hypothetical protein
MLGSLLSQQEILQMALSVTITAFGQAFLHQRRQCGPMIHQSRFCLILFSSSMSSSSHSSTVTVPSSQPC